MSRDLRLLCGGLFGVAAGVSLVGLPLGFFGGAFGLLLASAGPASHGPVSQDARVVAGALFGATIGLWIGGAPGAVVLGVVGMLIVGGGS